MIQKLKQGIFPFLIAISALSVSASAAFYSVSGLSKLFAGASFEVTIMAASLEVAKLVIASLLYQYWDKLNKLLRTYLTVAAVVLVLITSMGIYGFLSAAYQDTYRQLTIKNNEVSFLQQKVDFYQADVTRYDEELARISQNISTLSNAKATSIQVRDTTSSTGFRSTISTAELRAAQKRISVEEENKIRVQTKREIAADSLQSYQFQILELENNLDVAGELGPLEYISGLTGAPMDKIINILLLVIIFVFDPLAISLVVAANFAFAQITPKTRENIYGEKEVVDPFAEWNDDDGFEVEADPNDLPDLEETPLDKPAERTKAELARKEDWDLHHPQREDDWMIVDENQDGVIDEEEKSKGQRRIEELKNMLRPGISAFRRNRINREIEDIKDQIDDDENSIRYL